MVFQIDIVEACLFVTIWVDAWLQCLLNDVCDPFTAECFWCVYLPCSDSISATARLMSEDCAGAGISM